MRNGQAVKALRFLVAARLRRSEAVEDRQALTWQVALRQALLGLSLHGWFGRHGTSGTRTGVSRQGRRGLSVLGKALRVVFGQASPKRASHGSDGRQGTDSQVCAGSVEVTQGRRGSASRISTWQGLSGRVLSRQAGLDRYWSSRVEYQSSARQSWFLKARKGLARRS